MESILRAGARLSSRHSSIYCWLLIFCFPSKPAGPRYAHTINLIMFLRFIIKIVNTLPLNATRVINSSQLKDDPPKKKPQKCWKNYSF